MSPNRTDPSEKCRKYCIRLLSLRARTEQEMTRRLLSRGYPPQVCEDVLNGLKEQGLINDRSFACDWIEQRLARKNRSLRMIRQELREKGVSDGHIADAMEKAARDTTEKDLAFMIAEKKAASAGSGEPKRIYRYLVRKGFGHELAQDAVRDCLGEDAFRAPFSEQQEGIE